MPEGGVARVLVVEDDRSILLGLRMNLEAEGYHVETAADGESGLKSARSHDFDLIVLDLMLPKLDGFEFVCTLRAEHNTTPILILSARGSELDKIMGLDLGADDYLTKPFSVGELLARVRAIARRRGRAEPTVWRFGQVEIDPGTREVRRKGSLVKLTSTEFDILAALIRANGRVVSRDRLMAILRGPEHYGTRRTIDNFIVHLRSLLEDDPGSPRHITTVRGVGYRIVR
ncbi:MAG: response regulator transcription factor [Acidobacteriota bacterium]